MQRNVRCRHVLLWQGAVAACSHRRMHAQRVRSHSPSAPFLFLLKCFTSACLSLLAAYGPPATAGAATAHFYSSLDAAAAAGGAGGTAGAGGTPHSTAGSGGASGACDAPPSGSGGGGGDIRLVASQYKALVERVMARKRRNALDTSGCRFSAAPRRVCQAVFATHVFDTALCPGCSSCCPSCRVTLRVVAVHTSRASSPSPQTAVPPPVLTAGDAARKSGADLWEVTVNLLPEPQATEVCCCVCCATPRHPYMSSSTRCSVSWRAALRCVHPP